MAPLPLSSRSNVLSAGTSLLKRASSSISYSAKALPSLLKRQQSSTSNIIPTVYTDINGMQPGAIVGITLGSVALFLLLLWLLYTLMGGNMNPGAVSEVGVVEVERKRSRRGSRSSRRSEATSVRRERVVPVVERVVVEERRTSRPPPPPAVVASSLGSDDEVVVIEEHSPPRRSKSKRSGGPSGYRSVDPMAYGGGDMPLRGVERGSSRRSSGR